MQEEAWQMVPRNKRPQPYELEGYEQQHESDPDYGMYRQERGAWIYDFQRSEEENRERQSQEQQGITPLEGHDDLETIEMSRSTGFDRDTFDVSQVIRKIDSRPSH